jgi:adenylate kinase
MERQQAILLLGPTGAGKTPLGEWLEVHGLWSHRCHHFDFGLNLREIAAGNSGKYFSHEEVLFLRDVVDKGVLLENESFPLALKILRGFISAHRVESCDTLVMNGLPRHAGQAEALAPLVDFVSVVELNCSAATVWERLHSNAGGDRADRTDDEITLVEKKLTVFAARTQPLLNWYRSRGVPCIRLAVGPDTQPAILHAILEGHGRRF